MGFLLPVSNCLVPFAGFRQRGQLFVVSALLCGLTLCGWIGVAKAQSFPIAKPSLPTIPSLALPGNLAAAALKPEIPYLEELRQIQALKHAYDSLRTRLKTLKEMSGDSTLKDSALILAKSHSRAVLERERSTLNDMLFSDDIPDADLGNAIGNTLNGINLTEQGLENAKEVVDMESLMDSSGENLKALTNEWVMPKVGQHISGTLDQGWDPVLGQVPDYFGSGGLSLLETPGESAEDILALARKHAMGKGRHISDEYLRQAGSDFRKLKVDSLGEIQVTKASELKQKSAFFEPNILTGKSGLERTGLYLWYDPLTPFGEGVYVESGLSYGFSQQVRVFAGGVIRRHFGNESWPEREGQGVLVGVRVSKGNWVFQGNLIGCETKLKYPRGNENLNFQGKTLSSTVGVGRTISMGPNLQSVVMVGGDPLYRKERSLTGTAVQLRIGFELKHLSGGDKKKDK